MLKENKLSEQRGRLVTKLLFVLGLHLIGWEDSRSFPDQSPGVIEPFDWVLWNKNHSNHNGQLGEKKIPLGQWELEVKTTKPPKAGKR